MSTIFYQFFEHESSTYTYLLGDSESGEAAIVDSVFETFERDLQWIEELGLNVKYVIDTHVHADHITGAGEIRKRTGAKSALSHIAGVGCADIGLREGDDLHLGKKVIRVFETPGHTNSCLCLLFEGRLLTGDCLLIRGTGRTDFQQGSSEKLFESVHNKLFTLPDDTAVYPGHDYRGQMMSTIGLEKKFNPRLGAGKGKADFVRTMSELKLADPKKIHEALPANMACGSIQKEKSVQPPNQSIPEIMPDEVKSQIGNLRLIDVRRPEEFDGELGHIRGAELVTLGPELTQFLEKQDRNQEIVFVCRSGGRSGQATVESLRMGFRKSRNMVGGMLKWNELKYPVA